MLHENDTEHLIKTLEKLDVKSDNLVATQTIKNAIDISPFKIRFAKMSITLKNILEIIHVFPDKLREHISSIKKNPGHKRKKVDLTTYIQPIIEGFRKLFD